MSEPRVFLSYAHEDRAWVRAFAGALRRRGVSLWVAEREVQAGDDLAEASSEALRSSDAVLLLLGPQSAGKPALFFAWGAALALNKRIISIVAEELERSGIPAPLRHVRSLLRRDPEGTAEEVARAVAA